MEVGEKQLERHEKSELIALIKVMLLLEPELQWLLQTSLPHTTQRNVSLDAKLYRQQVLAAMAAGDVPRKRKHGEVQRKLTAINAIADAFAEEAHYKAALTIYEVLVTEIIAHYNDYPDEYIAFSVTLMHCIDGLDTCFAGEEDNPEIRLRVLQTLFAIYRFYVDTGMDLDEDIPGLLVGNTTPQERGIFAGWVREAISHASTAKWNATTQMQTYTTLLTQLEKQ
jgi:hypothetical protein